MNGPKATPKTRSPRLSCGRSWTCSSRRSFCDDRSVPVPPISASLPAKSPLPDSSKARLSAISEFLGFRERCRLIPSGTDRLKVTHPDRLKVTHLVPEDGRSGQERQVDLY